MEEEKKEHELKMKKMEADMEQVFESKVSEKMQKLRDSEAEVSLTTTLIGQTSTNLFRLQFAKRHEQAAKLLEQQRIDLEERKAAFLKEQAAFDMVHREMEDMRRASTMDANSRE